MLIEEHIKHLVDKYKKVQDRYGDCFLSKEIEGEIDRCEIMQQKGYKYYEINEQGTGVFKK